MGIAAKPLAFPETRLSYSGKRSQKKRIASSYAGVLLSYEVTDAKMKRRTRPKHVLLQLTSYSHLLEEIQDVMPEHAHMERVNGRRENLRLEGYA